MKGSKSPDSTEVTPSKKKLKQARLPFMVLSDVSPKTIQPRKRKLSDPQDETVSKIGKISNENIKDSIVISDEECQEITESPKDEKVVNPFVKLVNTAYKKKVLKSKKKKAAKKNATSKETQEDMPSSENEGITNKVSSDIEAMEVDECVVENGDVTTKDKNDESTNIINNNIPPKNKNNTEDAVPSTQKNTEDAVPSTQKNTEDSNIQNNTSIIIEDSNDTTDQSPTKEITNIENKIEGSESIESAKKPQKKTQVKSSSPKVTPQRSSLRNRSKIEKRDKLNDSSSSSKLEEPINSTPTTPKTPRQNKSIVNGQDADVSLNNSTNTTPKQAQKRLESAKKKEEREKEKLERELKKQQEKEERARQKLEKDEQRKKEKEEKEAAKKKEREDKEELKRKEKEEKEKQRELEKKLREEKEELKKKEKEEKEEQRKKEKEAREEEKRKKQEALELEKQEQELKKKKAAEAFVNFFVPKQKTDKEQTTIESSKNSMLSTFAVKSDMRLAPTTRNEIGENEKKILEDFILKQNVPKENLYINSLKSGSNKPLSSTKTWPIGDKDDDDDVVIVEDELPPMSVSGEMITCEPAIREKLRPKLLSFHQNRRPPYWGTWRKKSSNIKPRKPFGQDEKLDYEIDSDDDWEEEQEGESLDGSVAGSDDEQDNDEYEVDNEVFVPHGYLSDEEATMDEDDVLSLTPEAQKQKLKHLEEEFEFEHKKPTEKLKPRLYGLLWETNEGGKPENCVDALYNYFGKLSMIMDDPTPFLKPIKVPDDVEKKKLKKKKAKTESKEGEQPSPKAEKKKKTAEAKESKKERPRKVEPKKVDVQKKNQPGINSFLTKIKPT